MNTLPKRNHEDSKYDSQFALRAILDYELLAERWNKHWAKIMPGLMDTQRDLLVCNKSVIIVTVLLQNALLSSTILYLI